ncbi:MAG: biotin--[acetyl-CoA-carboxylase] ligase [Deltaproteobacteria bacterium]|nr:biotin--[acetyl-CoA-carboxylase] ligase [Deltaproteobacteria bacterium]
MGPSLPMAEMLASRLGRPVHWTATTGSTNDDARRLAEAGAPSGTLVVADAQAAGRGRLGRAWYSPPGQNLYLSLVLRPGTRPEDTPLLCLAAGLGVAEALDLRVKWPNDVVDSSDRKVAGLLAEAEIQGLSVRYVVVGVGINVNQPSFPPEIPTAASLAMIRGSALDRWEILARVVPAMEARLTQVEDRRETVLAQWRQRSATLGRRVRAGGREGLALGLREDGALLLGLDGGAVEAILAGDVEPAPLR